jgi:dephospho-CoA kinase
MMLGLTGCPGSGKTVVAKVLDGRGWQVIDADLVGKDVIAGDNNVIESLSREFGHDIVKPDGTLDRRLLARRAFATAEETAVLNAIVHPALTAHIRDLIADKRNAGSNTVVDCALIYEWGIDNLLDLVVCVHADPELRMNRIMKRDGRTREEIERLFAAQLTEAVKMSRADLVLANNGTEERLESLALLLDCLPRLYDRR